MYVAIAFDHDSCDYTNAGSDLGRLTDWVLDLSNKHGMSSWFIVDVTSKEIVDSCDGQTEDLDDVIHLAVESYTGEWESDPTPQPSEQERRLDDAALRLEFE